MHVLQAAVNSCAQGGVRKGSATAFYPFWHRDAEEFIVLKNNRGTEETRVRHLDYGIQFNKLILERISPKSEKRFITLFSPNEVPGLRDKFYSDDYEGFKALYEEYEADPIINSRQVDAMQFLTSYFTERAQTGRYYYQDAYWSNAHGPFNPEYAPIRQSNLCLEIALPTKPLGANVDDPDAEIALCTLSAFNLLKIKTPEQFQEAADIVVRVLDELLDYQDYPMQAAWNSTEKYRPLGVGVVNFAAAIAELGFAYGDQNCLDWTHRTFEQLQFSLMTASVALAKEKGRCKGYNDLRLANNTLLIDTYCKNVDQITTQPLLCDWDGLREDIAKYGIRNATLTAMMPSETSSQVLGATNGIEPIRGYVVAKDSKHGIMKQVIPNPHLAKNYTIAWEMGDCIPYLKTVAVMQKFTDQAISANTYDDPANHPGGQTPVKVLLQQQAAAVKFGIKTLYYHNTRETAEDTGEIVFEHVEECGGGGCKI